MAPTRRGRPRRRHRRLPAPVLRTHRARHRRLEKALAGLGLLDQALALDLRKPQDYFHRVWSTAFRASDLTESDTKRKANDTNDIDDEETCA
jgi:hypothetical protein